MSEQNQEYQSGESYIEEEQQYINSESPTMETYNPMDDDGMMPYVPSTQKNSNNSQQYIQESNGVEPMQGFIDLNQMGNFSNQNNQQQNQDYNPNQQYQQNLVMNQPPSGPNEMNAHKNLELMESVMDKVEGISNTTKKEGDTNRVYATDVALKSLYSALSTLKEIEYWIPEGKEELVPKLQQIANPITNALQSYVDSIERLK